MKSFDKYKFDWYINYFLEVNFSRYFIFNEYLNENNIITGDINYNCYYMMGYFIIDISSYTDKKDDFVNIVDNIICSISDFNKDDFELVKKESGLKVSVRNDYINYMVDPLKLYFF